MCKWKQRCVLLNCDARLKTRRFSKISKYSYSKWTTVYHFKIGLPRSKTTLLSVDKHTSPAYRTPASHSSAWSRTTERGWCLPHTSITLLSMVTHYRERLIPSAHQHHTPQHGHALQREAEASRTPASHSSAWSRTTERGWCLPHTSITLLDMDKHCIVRDASRTPASHS